MIRISALTQGLNVASARFRVRQYLPALLKQDILVKEYPAILYDNKLPGITARFRQRYIFPVSAGYEFVKLAMRLPHGFLTHFSDATWLCRSFYNTLPLEGLLKKPLIYDIDDALWINNEKRIFKIAENATTIFAGNTFIANKLEHYNKSIYIIPTAIDTDRFKPGNNKAQDIFVIIWTGSRQTQHYLLSIEEALNSFLKEHNNAYLSIISDSIPVFKFIPKEKILFQKWQPEIEATALQNADVGIMPLFDTEWEKGKCSFKMLQYMSSGLPVIVSPVGMNEEVFRKGEIGFTAIIHNEWYDALNTLYIDKKISQKFGIAGREIVLRFYSLEKVSMQIADVLKSLV